ncbi:MAG: LemA family protein [Candidatus Omnitrophota bacterium]
MNKVLIIVGILVVVLLMAAGWFIGELNNVVKLDENINEKWSQVENQLQRRNDLIPNLVNTVKGYAAHEEGIFTEVTKLRSQWGNASNRAEKMEAAEGMGGALSRLLLVAENYPDLKANQNFLSLQAQIEGTENRISTERNRYNKAVKEFNSYRRTVFGGFFAGLRGLNKPSEYFEVEAAAKAVPKVEF